MFVSRALQIPSKKLVAAAASSRLPAAWNYQSHHFLSTAPAPAEEAPVEDASSAAELQNQMRPDQVVEQLDRYIVGQKDAKRAVAIAMRNRWRRMQLPEDLRKEVTPRNVLLVG